MTLNSSILLGFFQVLLMVFFLFKAFPLTSTEDLQKLPSGETIYGIWRK